MKLKFSLLAVLISSISMFGQNFEKLLYSKKNQPTIIINEKIIANWEMINSLPKDAIKEIRVMKSKQADSYAKSDPNLSAYGLILCKADVGKLETKTQKEIRQFLGADVNTKIYIDGFLLKDETHLIATKSIKEIEFISPNEEDLNSRDTLVTEVNVLENFDPKIPESMQDAEILLLGNLHPGVQLSVLEKMNNRPKLVILDTMNFWMDSALDILLQMIAKTDVISINDEEARQLSGEYSLVKAAQKIHEMGPQFVIIKKGEHGALLFHDGKIFAIPALPLEEVYDPTGAGDTFAGGFASYLAKKEDFSFETMKSALIVGSAMASFTVEKFGTQRLEEVTEGEMIARIKSFKELTTFQVHV